METYTFIKFTHSTKKHPNLTLLEMFTLSGATRNEVLKRLVDREEKEFDFIAADNELSGISEADYEETRREIRDHIFNFRAMWDSDNNIEIEYDKLNGKETILDSQVFYDPIPGIIDDGFIGRVFKIEEDRFGEASPAWIKIVIEYLMKHNLYKPNMIVDPDAITSLL